MTATPTARPAPQATAIFGLPDEPQDETPDKTLPPTDYDGEVRALRTDEGIMLTVRGGSAGEWEVVTPCFEIATVSEGEEISGLIDVLIDPGHGGSDEPGAVGPNGLVEADVNLAVSKLLEAKLTAQGYAVEMTRHSDHRIAIQARTELANSIRPRILVSVHHNGGFPSPSDTIGTEVFVQEGDASSRRLGGLIFEEIEAAFAGFDLDWVANDTRGVSWRVNSRGTDLYGMLRRTPGLVTVLTEAMFITSGPEAELLADPAVREAEAQALADGIHRWFETQDLGVGFIDGLVFRGSLGSGGGTDACVDPPLS